MSVSIRHTVSPTMTEEEQKLLRSIGAVRRYPVCRFELRSSKDRELCSVALDAVHLQDAGEEIGPVKERATLLKSLEQKGMIVLYYGLTTYVKSDYQIFHDSAVFHQLQEPVLLGLQGFFPALRVCVAKGDVFCRLPGAGDIGDF